jgi:hypothetical protein
MRLVAIASGAALVLLASRTLAWPGRAELVHSQNEVDIVGETVAAKPARTASDDTTWIADWSFDSPSGCVNAGWTKFDNRILNDGSNQWTVQDTYSGLGGISRHAAVLAKHDLCWVYPDGVGVGWDQGIRVLYRGATMLSFRYLLDSGPGVFDYDGLSVEADQGCASFSRDPVSPWRFWTELLTVHGLVTDGRVDSLALPDFGDPQTTHCVYLRFTSGDAAEDGTHPGTLGAGLVVDNIRTSGGSLPLFEDFEGPLDPNVAFLNLLSSQPFGEWARVYAHATDNDKCTENTTCAWIWTDPTLPATAPSMAFGPGGTIVRNWLDDIIVSPWVRVPQGGGTTTLTFRELPANPMGYGRIVRNWSVRSRTRIENTDTPATGDSIDCVGRWGHASSFSSLNSFAWVTRAGDLSPYLDAQAREIQVAFRVTDWWLISDGCDLCYGRTGPGPYIDRVRIGRRPLAGPVISEGSDSRSQAQDAFPTVRNGIGSGEHFSPDSSRFGSCAFSAGADLGSGRSSPNLITADSIWVQVTDARGVGGIRSVDLYGAIVSGPHAGKTPPPWSVAANGFFRVPAESVRVVSGAPRRDYYFVDVDDAYFRGGDVLVYFWSAVDATGGFASDPPGLALLPVSVAAAEAATGGLLEVSYLPAVRWSADYLARIAAHPSGKLEPTALEVANSTQANCVLYTQIVNGWRRTGPANRTSFMYTLDVLGYRGHYDVYDVQGYGNTNNQLGGRASVEQAKGYALIVHDAGSLSALTLPDGLNLDSEKIDQTQWYRDWLASAPANEAGTATLWIIGENVVQEKATNPLLQSDMGLVLTAANQGSSVSPDVQGQTSFTWANGTVADFTSDRFSLNGGCPSPRNYDGLGATGTAVISHRFASGDLLGLGAIVLNRNAALHWNTILSSFGWFDIRDALGGAPGVAPTDLAGKILMGVLPQGCRSVLDPTDVSARDPVAPRRTALYPNVPNPFNPVTTIRFDLASDRPVSLRVFDVSGRLVRDLLEAKMPRGQHAVAWNGADESGRRVASGIYIYRFTAGDFAAARRMVLLK